MKGREYGIYNCTVNNNIKDFINDVNDTSPTEDIIVKSKSTHLLTDLPTEGIHSISVVATAENHLPSNMVGPVNSSMYIYCSTYSIIANILT